LSKSGGGGAPATTVQQVMDGMKDTFNKDAAKGMNAVYLFDLT
jgi:hypothetical protein